MFDPELGLINSQGLIATRIGEKYKQQDYGIIEIIEYFNNRLKN